MLGVCFSCASLDAKGRYFGYEGAALVYEGAAAADGMGLGSCGEVMV